MIRSLLRPPNRGRASAAFLLAAAVAVQSAQCATIRPVITSGLTEVRQQAEAGDSQAQNALGEAYYHQFEPTLAVQWFHKAAEQGVANSIREGQRRAAVSGDECEVCRRLLEEERNPGVSLELKGITGVPKKPLALISGQVFAPGEEAIVSLRNRKILVKCLEIGEASAAVLVEGNRIVLLLAGSE